MPQNKELEDKVDFFLLSVFSNAEDLQQKSAKGKEIFEYEKGKFLNPIRTSLPLKQRSSNKAHT